MKHTVHLACGGRVEIDGDRVAIYLAGPIVVHRKHWVRYFLPEEEVRRTILASNPAQAITDALVTAFSTVPMTVHPESETP